MSTKSKIVSITSETFFLVNNLFTNENLILLLVGRILANKNLPAVLVYFSILIFPFSSNVLKVDIIFECKLIDLLSKACSISSIPAKIPFGFFLYRQIETNNKFLKLYLGLVQ